MNLQESGEMYLETILRLTDRSDAVRSIDVCDEMGFSKPSVSRAVGILKNTGLATGALDLLGTLYYPILLGITLLISIALHRKSKQG